MKIRIISFGFSFGIPPEASVVFDARLIRDPHREHNLRELRGTDAAVSNRVLQHPMTPALIAQIEAAVAYRANVEGKQQFTFGIGCSRGHHRSVAIAEHVAAKLRTSYDVKVLHPHIEREG